MHIHARTNDNDNHLCELDASRHCKLIFLGIISCTLSRTSPENYGHQGLANTNHIFQGLVVSIEVTWYGAMKAIPLQHLERKVAKPAGTEI